LSLAVYVTV